MRYLAQHIGIAPPGQSDPDSQAGTVVFRPEVQIRADPGEQNALVFDTPSGQSTVVNFKKAGAWCWQINCTGDVPPKLTIVALDEAGAPTGPPVLSIDYSSGVVDFASPPTVLGTPLAPAAAAAEAPVTSSTSTRQRVSGP